MSKLDSKTWGPYVWYFIHQVAFRLNQNSTELSPYTKKTIHTFYTTLKPLLPCPSCQMHYGWTLSKIPVSKHLTTGIKTSKWTVTAHNLANKGLGKKEVYYEMAKKMYTQPGGIYYILNHKILHGFIHHILINSNNKPLGNRIQMARCICNLYPCLKCRKRLLDFLKKHDLKNIKNNIHMITWAKKLKIVALQKCL